MKSVVRVVVVILLFVQVAYSEDYVGKALPTIDMIKRAYESKYKYSSFDRVVGAKITSYGTMYTIHFITKIDAPIKAVKGAEHLRRLRTYRLDTLKWIIDYGGGYRDVLQK